MRDPIVFQRLLSREPDRISAQTIQDILPETRVRAKDLHR